MSKELHSPQADDPQAKPHVGHPDDLIVVPKGSSKVRYIMLILLVVMLLTTFSVGPQVIDVLTGQGRSSKAFMRWNNPAEGKKSVSAADFMTEKQQLNKFWGLATGGRSSAERSDEDTAYYILLSDLAEHAGVRVTDKELQDFIQRRFQTSDQYRAQLASFRMTPREFEETLRRFLRMERYQNLLATSLAIADPDEIEKLWKARHQEYAFDYVELPVASLTEEAAQLAPPTAELQAWFDALSDVEKQAYKTQPAASGEIAVFPLEGEAPAEALLAKYPLPADTDLEKLARDYYDGFSYVRFKNAEFKPTGQQLRPEDLFLPYEKVEAAAKREAPLYRALSMWLADLSARAETGEPIQLATEAASLGLEYHDEPEPKTAEQWREITQEKPAIGYYVAESMLSNGTEGKWLPAVSVDQKGLAVARVHTKKDAVLPPFAEIEAQAREAWTKKKAGELAVAKLEVLRDPLGTRPAAEDKAAPPYRPEADADKLAAVAKDAGLEVKRYDFAERTAKLEAPTPFDLYLRQNPTLYTFKENTVAKAELSAAGDNAYVVRVAGVRDANTSQMTPADVQNLSRQIAQQAMDKFRERTFNSPDLMKERYGLELETWNRPEKSAPN